ncbi:Flp family type IVb pilin [bacterium]|nr:Flp family type IVb pilin [bacterium]
MARWFLGDGRNERGATMVEYTLLACCLSIVCIAAVSALGQESRETFTTIERKMAATNFPGAVTPTGEPE